MHIVFECKNAKHQVPYPCLPSGDIGSGRKICRASSSLLKSNCRFYLTSHDISLSHKKDFRRINQDGMCFFIVLFWFPPLCLPLRRSPAFLPCAPSVPKLLVDFLKGRMCQRSGGSQSDINVPKHSWCRGEHVCGCVGT